MKFLKTIKKYITKPEELKVISEVTASQSKILLTNFSQGYHEIANWQKSLTKKETHV